MKIPTDSIATSTMESTLTRKELNRCNLRLEAIRRSMTELLDIIARGCLTINIEHVGVTPHVVAQVAEPVPRPHSMEPQAAEIAKAAEPPPEKPTREDMKFLTEWLNKNARLTIRTRNSR